MSTRFSAQKKARKLGSKMKKLYIIHGWSFRNIQPWVQVKEKLAEKGIDAELLCVPGFDLTKEDRTVYDINDYIAFVYKNIPKGSIALGHSNGGRILLNLMSRDSEHLKGCILLSAAGIYEPSRKRDLLRKLSKILAPFKKIGILRKGIHKIIGASDYNQAPDNMKQTLTNMLDSDKELDITGIKTPVRIIWGEDDTTTPLRQGQRIHESIKGSTLRVVPNWKHAPYLDHAGELSEIIAEEYKKLTQKKHD